MKQIIPSLTLVASLLAGTAAFAQTPADPAKGNAPLKTAHTVNDGGARHGANSFTQKQAQQHIEKSGFTDVSGLTKGHDGVWRGKATRGGQATDVAMDFKGNVTTPSMAATSNPPATPMQPPVARSEPHAMAAATTAGPGSGMASTSMSHRSARRQTMRHHAAAMPSEPPVTGDCMHPGPEGAACSGVDLNRNGIADKAEQNTGPQP